MKLINQDNQERDLFFSIDINNVKDDTEWVQRLKLNTDVQVRLYPMEKSYAVLWDGYANLTFLIKVAVMHNAYKNAGAHSTAIAEHPKTMDFIWRGCDAITIPPISIRETETLPSMQLSWVNVIGFLYNRQKQFKIGKSTGNEKVMLTFSLQVKAPSSRLAARPRCFCATS